MSQAEDLALDFDDLESVPGDGSHLSKSQIRQIERYMKVVLESLDLSHWRVYVAVDKPPDGALLMIQPTDGRRVAMLYIAEHWWDRQRPEEKCTDLTHEALHLAHHDMDEAVRRFIDASEEISWKAKRTFIGQFKTDCERMVDSLSYVCAELVPPWEDEEDDPV